MKKKFFYNNASVLLMVLAFMLTLLIFASVFLRTVVTSTKNAGYQVISARALYLAEAGLNKAEYYLLSVSPTAPDGTTNASWRTTPAYSSSGSTYSSCSVGACSPKTETFGSGSYTMWLDNSGSDIKITSCGLYNGLSRTVQFIVTSLMTAGSTSPPVATALRGFYPVAGSWKEPIKPGTACP